MKFLITAVVFSLFANSVFAYSLGIVDIDAPIGSEESYSIYGSDGKMYSIDLEDEELVELAITAIETKIVVEVELEVLSDTKDILELRSKITAISLSSMETDKSLSSKLTPIQKDGGLANIKNSYVTDFSTEAEVVEKFNTQRNNARSRSQCYNRAHVWAWELNKFDYNSRKVQVGKIWLFFTKKYIRSHNYKWWFHIAPYVTVNSELRVMDRLFLSKPANEKGWTDEFIQTKQACTEVYQYSDQANNQYVGDCYVIKTSLWYWQPFQVENAETRNEEREGWNSYEVKKAYKNAHGWFARVP